MRLSSQKSFRDFNMSKTRGLAFPYIDYALYGILSDDQRSLQARYEAFPIV